MTKKEDPEREKKKLAAWNKVREAMEECDKQDRETIIRSVAYFIGMTRW